MSDGGRCEDAVGALKCVSHKTSERESVSKATMCLIQSGDTRDTDINQSHAPLEALFILYSVLYKR